MILVLDLDQTLVNAVADINAPGDFRVLDHFSVTKRPYLDEFVKFVTQNKDYEVGVWSAGVGSYVRAIVDNIFPDPSILKFVEARDFTENYRKPLTKIVMYYNEKYKTHLDISSFVLIDDRKHVTRYTELNHILIPEFNGDPKDTELLTLIKFLNDNRGISSECLVVNWQV